MILMILASIYALYELSKILNYKKNVDTLRLISGMNTDEKKDYLLTDYTDRVEGLVKKVYSYIYRFTGGTPLSDRLNGVIVIMCMMFVNFRPIIFSGLYILISIFLLFTQWWWGGVYIIMISALTIFSFDLKSIHNTGNNEKVISWARDKIQRIMDTYLFYLIDAFISMSIFIWIMYTLIF